MEGFSELKDIVVSKSTIYAQSKNLQPRKLHENTRRSGATSMDDLVPQRPNRKSSNRSTVITSSSHSSVQSPSSATSLLSTNNIYQTSSAHTSNIDYTPYSLNNKNSIPLNKDVQAESASPDSSHTQEGFTGPITANISTSSTNSKHRSRDGTVDSLTSVKFKPAVTKFEDLKSEAIGFWNEGVDIELVDSQNKKKTEWLSQSAFFSEDTMPLAADDASIASESGTSDVNIVTHAKQSYSDAVNNKSSMPDWVDSVKQYPTMSNGSNNPAWARNTVYTAPDWLTNVKQSSAQNSYPSSSSAHHTAYNKPAWSQSNEHAIPEWASEKRFYGNQETQEKLWMQSMNPQQMQHMAPVVMVSSPYIPMPHNAYRQPQPNMSHSADQEWMRCFYSVITKYNHRAIINSFQKKIDTVLRSLSELSFRSFGLLLHALTVVMEYEANLNELETARKINMQRQAFLYYLVAYIQNYATLPDDIKIILQFSVTMSRFFPQIYQDLPMDDIVRIYEDAKSITNQDMITEFVKQLNLLKATSIGGNAFCNGDLDHSLPSLPIADKVVTEVIEKVRPLEDYETKKEIVIANKLHNPWPNVDLTMYTLYHFLMLRDEMVGPVQRIIKQLFKAQSSENISVPDCSVYEKTKPISSTLSFQTSDPCIVFKLGTLLPTDQIVSDFEEGSLVFILPEFHASISPADQHGVKKQVAKTSMMGQAIRASSTYSNHGEQFRLVSIHIDREDIHKLNWDHKYTIVTSTVNASSTKAVLKWLYNEHLKPEKKHWSSVLTPRVLAANNTLTPSQITYWNDENHGQAVITNEDTIPDYLANAEFDVSCIMTKPGNQRANPGKNIWPEPPSIVDLSMAASRRLPDYNLSPSQVKAVKFVLTHRIAVVAGPPGSGKTFLASKLAQLMSEALTVGLFHQPILIITKTQSSLDDILKRIVAHIPDVVRFGSEPYDDVLKSKQATLLAAPAVSDSNFRQFQSLERQLTSHQAKLHTLIQERAKIKAHSPSILSSAVPPPYRSALIKGFNMKCPSTDPINRSQSAIWTKWIDYSDKLTQNYAKSKASQSDINHAQWTLENTYLQRGGRGIMPMTDTNMIRNRFMMIASNAPQIMPISDAAQWPFDRSAGLGADLRNALLEVWKRYPPEQIWDLPDVNKARLVRGLVKVLASAIDREIEDVLQQQLKTAQSYDEIMIQKWTYLCRFNRVIGMTADFAAANHDWVSTLWPRSVIVDEASEILESTIASTILGPRTEHLVLLGTSDDLFKPRITNPGLAGQPRNFNVSLFGRWKGSNSELTRLEEQWRMHSEVADIIDKFNSIKKTSLITAPLISYAENKVDGKNPNLEALYGITQRAFYVDYQASDDAAIDNYYSKLLHSQVTNAQVDEARYVASLAVYLSQQQHSTPGITVLTLSIVQKYLIRHILREEIPKRTCFTRNISKIHLDTVEQYTGRQNNFAIVSTATPGHSFSNNDNITRALTRAKYGLYIIGKPGKDRVHSRWNDFANFMKDNELFGPSIQLTCYTHGDSLFAGQWQDFLKMKNGGCQQPCATLMSDGHACKEKCHFGGHDQIVCQEPCTRIRPSNCTHECQKKCFECAKTGVCPPCPVETTVQLECGHDYEGICHKLQNLDLVECQEQVPHVFQCGHETMIKCCQTKKAKRITCCVEIKVDLPCGHTVMSRCGEKPVCTHPCDRVLECGHKCQYVCGEMHSHDRSDCTASCSKQLICGHRCAKGCKNPDDHTERCTEKCNYVCSHGYKCSRECFRDCIRCISECPYVCKHLKCSKKCFEICDRPPCNEPCKKTLSCSHTCSGLCGEPCPPCVSCNGDLKCSITLRNLSEFEPDEKVYILPECRCVFSSEALDLYFQNQAKNGEHTAVKVWGCPTCSKTIYTALRYNQYVKTEINLVNKIKMRLEKERQQLSSHEREQIISAMNDETRNHAIHSMVGGRWFVCQNQHPYYVGDCGGATEVSKCPECEAPIGGTQHKVVESNRFYGEFDGSEKPAWPGQPGADA